MSFEGAFLSQLETLYVTQSACCYSSQAGWEPCHNQRLEHNKFIDINSLCTCWKDNSSEFQRTDSSGIKWMPPQHLKERTTVWVKPPWGLVAIFPKRLGIFQPNFTCLLCVPICARLLIFIQLPATLTKLCRIKHYHLVHIMCARCPPSAETHAGIFWRFPQTIRNF